MKRSLFFIILLTISSLALAGTAAYFSIFGLAKLFYGAGIGIVILASVLEFSKLVAVSYVYRYWSVIAKALRAYYVFGVVFIMLLTSIGIYGFLTSAYQKSANKIEIRDSQVKIAENKKTLFVSQLERINKNITSNNNRIDQLSNVRGLQEKRLDNLYDKKQSVRDERKSISGADEQIKFLNGDITEKMKQASAVNDSIAFYDQRIVEYKASDVSSEVGPLKYLSDLTGWPMNRVVNILVLLIIFVFDPMAISLLIGVNQLTMMDKEKKPLHEDKVKIPFFNRKKKEEELEDDPEDESEPEIKEEPPKKVWRPMFTEPQNIEETEEVTEDTPEDPKKNSISENCQDGYEERKIELIKDNIKDNLRVFHEVFGEGHIIKSDLLKNRVFVQFESGVKELYLDFANLKEIRCIKKDDMVSEPYLDFFADDPEEIISPYQPAPEIIEPQQVPVMDEKEIIEQPVIEPVVESQKKKKFFQNLLTNLKKSTLLIRKNS